jgi:hypothetical protein
MKGMAVLMIPVGVYFVAAFLYAVARGRAVSGPDIVLTVLGAGLLITSVSVLLPSHERGWQRRLARLDAMPEEERRAYMLHVFRRQRYALLVAFLVEIPVALVFWSATPWDDWIASMLGTTLLLILVVTVAIYQQKTQRGTVDR